MAYATPNPAVGVLAKLGIGTSGSAATIPLDFNGETLGLRESFVDAQGLRGTRSHAAARVRRSSRLVTGGIQITPTAVELSNILPYVLSAGVTSGTGKNYLPAESLSAFGVDLLRGATLFRYTGCRVSRATFHATKGVPVQVSLDILGIDETYPVGAFPTLTLDNTTGYFIHEDSVQAITVGTTSIDCFDLTITIDNVAQPRLVNSQVATVVYTTDRIVTWRLDLPWGDAETLYNLAEAGVAASAVFTNGNLSLSFTSPALQVPRRSPDVEGRDEIHNIVEGVARYSAAPNDEITVFLDYTP